MEVHEREVLVAGGDTEVSQGEGTALENRIQEHHNYHMVLCWDHLQWTVLVYL